MQKHRPFFIICILLYFTACSHTPKAPDSAPESVPEKPVPLVEPASTGTAAAKEVAPEPDPTPEPAPPPPPPFTREQIDARILNLVYPGTLPVTRDGELLAVYEDLDGNGYRDACVLCVRDLPPEEATFEALSDDARLYREVLEPFSCSVQFFLQKNGKLYRSGIAPLGRKLLLESFHFLSLGKDPVLPAGAVVQFKSRGSTEQEWALYGSKGISRFTVTESLSSIPVIDDINADGVLDVVVHHQGFEEGRGYETFLIWYRWNGTEFIEYRSTNIVRNLNTYLDNAAEDLAAGRWDSFIRRSLTEEEEGNLRFDGLDNPEILSRIFRCEEGREDDMFFFESEVSPFLQVVFPDFFETPFSREDVNRFEIPVQVRFVSTDHVNYLCSAVIYMRRNPFEGAQFGFMIQEQ